MREIDLCNSSDGNIGACSSSDKNRSDRSPLPTKHDQNSSTTCLMKNKMFHHRLRLMKTAFKLLEKENDLTLVNDINLMTPSVTTEAMNVDRFVKEGSIGFEEEDPEIVVRNSISEVFLIGGDIIENQLENIDGDDEDDDNGMVDYQFDKETSPVLNPKKVVEHLRDVISSSGGGNGASYPHEFNDIFEDYDNDTESDDDNGDDDNGNVRARGRRLIDPNDVIINNQRLSDLILAAEITRDRRYDSTSRDVNGDDYCDRNNDDYHDKNDDLPILPKMMTPTMMKVGCDVPGWGLGKYDFHTCAMVGPNSMMVVGGRDR